MTITKEKKREIKRLRKKGVNKTQIARELNIAVSTVRYNLKEDNYKETQLNWQKDRYNSDPKFKKKVNEANRILQKKRYKEGRTWKHLHPIKAKKWNRKYNKIYYREHREEMRKKNKKYSQTEEYKKRHCEYVKKYNKKHKKEIAERNKTPKYKEYQKKYRKKNKQKYREYSKKWRRNKENIKKKKAYDKKRYKEKYLNNRIE